MDSSTLSNRDERVLSLLFDSESQAQSIGVETGNCPEVLPSDSDTEAIRSITRRAVALAEGGLLRESECLLNESIEKYPSARAASLNNRAQVRRLAGNVDGALEDLNRVIKEETKEETKVISSRNCKWLSDAHAHRATIYLLLAKREISGRLSETLDEEIFEEWASRDFATAGRYGNELARAMAVRVNPYAKLCGAIVQTALQKEMQPDQSRNYRERTDLGFSM